MATVKCKTFNCYQNDDQFQQDAENRFEKMKKKVLKWIKKNNIKVVNIKEEKYFGGHWVGEERGGEINVYYKK